MILVRVSPAPPYAKGEWPAISMNKITPRLHTSAERERERERERELYISTIHMAICHDCRFISSYILMTQHLNFTTYWFNPLPKLRAHAMYTVDITFHP